MRYRMEDQIFDSRTCGFVVFCGGVNCTSGTAVACCAGCDRFGSGDIPVQY